MTFRRRIALLAGLSFVAAVVLCSAVGFVTVRRQMIDQIDQDLLSRVDEPLDSAGLTPEQSRARRRAVVRALQLLRPTDVLVQTVQADGTVATPLNQTDAIPVTGADLEVAGGGRTAEPRLRTASVGDVRVRVVTAPLAAGGAVMIARPLTEIDQTLGRFASVLVVVCIGGAAAAAGVGWWVARRSARPVEQLTLAAEHVADTLEFDVGLTPRHDDEIGRLTTSIASMLAALRASRDQQHRLVMDASHELRTPLTSLRMNVQMLDHPDLDPEARAEVVADIRAELDELTNLSAELVDLATDAPASEPTEAVDLAALVARVAERAARRSGQRIEVDAGPARVEGQPRRLERAVQNLLDNATKWNDPAQPVEVQVHGGTVVVRDHGPGIDPAERQLVFERFYRSEAARATPGSGLGLSIVAHIAAAHGGTVRAEAPAAGGGAVLVLDLPAGPGPAGTSGPGAPPR